FPRGSRTLNTAVVVEKGDASGEYTVALQPTDPETVPLSLISTYLSLKTPSASREVPLLPLTILDLFLRQNPLNKASTHLLGRSLFTPVNAVPIGGGLEIWRGVFQSARLTEGSGVFPTTGAKAKKEGLLMVNIDLSFTSVFKAQDVLAFMKEVIPQSSAERKLVEGERRALELRIRNCRVELTHRKVGANGNSFVKKVVRGVSDKNAIETRFEHNGRTVNVAEYFLSNYNIRLRYPNLNLLKSGAPNGDSYFPMEVCRISEGTRYIGQMTENDRSGMIKASTQRPQEKKLAIEQAVASLDLKNNSHLKALGVEVDTRMVRVEGRILQQPILAYGKGKQIDPRGGAWNLIRTAYFAPAAMPSYGYVLMCGDRDMDEGGLWNLDTEVRGVFGETGMQIGHSDHVAYVRMGREINRQGLLAAIQGLTNRCNEVFPGTKGPVLFFFIVIVRHTYELIKTVMDREIGLPSQVMQAKKCKNPNRHSLLQYLANVSLKVNTKLGGINQRLMEPPADFVKGLDIIVVGADVTHYTGDDKPSIAAVVSTIDPPLTKYFPTVRLQSNKTEIIEDMQGIVKDALIAYYRTNQSRKPQRILFYRDGVSEVREIFDQHYERLQAYNNFGVAQGQFQAVFDSEIKAIKRACASLEKGYAPKITFTVMTKRHKTKIFVENPSPQNTDRSGNAQPGTVVDTTITHPYEYDFYLMSHAGIQGTSRPAHYYVLLDENQLSADVLQQFTYRLCYVYSRATRSVSLVPPTYYAHLLAYRARLYVNQGHTEITAHNNLVPGMTGKPTAGDFTKTMFYV
ncbi:Protein argonaute 10, partial [Gonapodya sp. JEL0774]